MERTDDFKSLVIAPENAADAIKKMKQDPGKVYDPEFDAYNSSKLLSVNGELRSSWIVTPTNGKLPLTKMADAAMSFERPSSTTPKSATSPSVAGQPRLSADPCCWRGDPLSVRPDAGCIRDRVRGHEPCPHRRSRRPAAPGRASAPARRFHGRWDGDTLIIETDNSSQPIRAALLPRRRTGQRR